MYTFTAFVRRILINLLILLLIIFLTLLGLYLAERSRANLPVEAVGAVSATLQQTGRYLFHHPQQYTWKKENLDAVPLVVGFLGNSAGLLLTSLCLAAVAGVLLGVRAATRWRKNAAPLFLLISVLGISIPSFLLAMLFWVLNLSISRWLDLNPAILPPTGFGWDRHLVLPALVLAARPLAQIAQISYASMTGLLDSDFVRAARSRGLPEALVESRHLVRNIWLPVATTLAASLRYSLASLPVIESFFGWPGVGATLLKAIELDMPALVTDLIVSLGALFLVVNLILDLLYPWLDPRLKKPPESSEIDMAAAGWSSLWENLEQMLADARQWLVSLPARWFSTRRMVPARRPVPRRTADGSRALEAMPAHARHLDDLWSILGNLPLILGLLLGIGLALLAVYGSQWSPANPYVTHGVRMINGEIAAPPFPPSSVFPWGSDVVGRDIQALVLSGARQTLTLALFATLARLLLGTLLGLLAGTWQHSRLDRWINSLIAVWAAFPVTLFAMILILALGIQRGFNVFVLALCLVGWGEVAQFVRAQVIAQKGREYVEAARSIGARPEQILYRHILPHLLPSLAVLASLEMAGVLMLLAELGYLNIFLGGGFKVEIGEAGITPVTYFFSDVPEWGSLLANIRNWWRSYPWLVWYPGAFFFAAILTFNLMGEGLRRLIDETHINLHRLVNRYTLLAGIVALGGLGWTLRSNTPIERYRPQAESFEVQRVQQDIQRLSGPEFAGRESGLPGARLAAQAIAERMQALGLQPAGDHDTFIQEQVGPLFHLTATPRLEWPGAGAQPGAAPVYRRDFAEFSGSFLTVGEGQGPIVAVVVGANPNSPDKKPYLVRQSELWDKIVLVRQADLEYMQIRTAAGLLVIAPDESFLSRRSLQIYDPLAGSNHDFPAMLITPALAERLLATAGTRLADLERRAASLQPNEVYTSAAGDSVYLSISGIREDLEERHYNVIGFIPGISGVKESSGARDDQVILVSAYYDGLGRGPDGQIYPGANDNASGVATLLEIARVLKNGPFAPKKTVLFVAWSRGERGASLSVKDVMNAKVGFNTLTVETIIELSGVGAGSGQAIALAPGSSYRLSKLYQSVAQSFDIPITSRGRGPHFGQLVQPGFGGRTAMSLYVSWDGSDQLAHTPQDTPASLDPHKLELVGKITTVFTTLLSRETDY